VRATDSQGKPSNAFLGCADAFAWQAHPSRVEISRVQEGQQHPPSTAVEPHVVNILQENKPTVWRVCETKDFPQQRPVLTIGSSLRTRPRKVNARASCHNPVEFARDVVHLHVTDVRQNHCPRQSAVSHTSAQNCDGHYPQGIIYNVLFTRQCLQGIIDKVVLARFYLHGIMYTVFFGPLERSPILIRSWDQFYVLGNHVWVNSDDLKNVYRSLEEITHV
jgi:hypothetical protein